MKNFLKSINVQPSIFQRLDAGEKNLITILALSVPVSCVVAGVVFFFSIQLLLESTLMALLAGAFIAYLLFLHDTSMLSEKGTGRAFFRLFLSIAIAVVVAVPLKIKFMGEALEQRYLEGIQAENLEVEKEMNNAKEAIYQEEKEIMATIQAAGTTYDQTGGTQELAEARRAKTSFLANKEQRLAAIEKLYGAKMKSVEGVTKLDLAAYFFTNMFSKSSPKELFVNLSVFILLLLIEALPAIVRLKLDEGKYLAKIVHQKQMREKADNEIEGMEKQILDMKGLEDLPNKLEKIRVWKELDKASEGGFQDTDKLIELSQQLNKKNQVPPQPTPPTSPVIHSNGNGKPKDLANDFPMFNYTK